MAVLNWFWEAESVRFIQQQFQKQFQPEPSTYPAIMTLMKKFDVTEPVARVPEIFLALGSKF